MTFITKRRLVSLVSASAIVASLAVAALPAAALGAVDAVTPSTNDVNGENGWAHVDVTAADGEATLTFTSTRAFVSCFEYRTDGDVGQQTSPTNHNPLVTDGLYPYVCVNNSTQTTTISADEYVEVRMVFGAEADERFAWTRFEVPQPQPECTPTGFVKDTINLTAAQIGGAVTGELDATGCDIGVYNPTSVINADIHGALYHGVVANGVAVNVTGSKVHDIGDSPFNGVQRGRAILYINGASGTISGNEVYDFQKTGIEISGLATPDGAALSSIKTTATVQKNVVSGLDHVYFIAQNGITIRNGASATVMSNSVSDLWYTGPQDATASGLLNYQASRVTASKNIFEDVQVDINGTTKGGHGKP